MADMINPLTPAEMQVQQQAIDRQRKIAEYLQQQSLTPEQGQMVSGHYVAPSPMQYIAKLAQGLLGKNQQESLDTKQKDLVTQQGDLTRLLYGIGKPAQAVATAPSSDPTSPQEVPSMPLGSGMSGIGTGDIVGNDKIAAALLRQPESPQQVPSTSAQAAQPVQASSLFGSRVIPGMDPLTAFSMATDPKTEAAYAGAYLKQFEPTDAMKNNRYMGISADEAAAFERAARTKAGLMEGQPGNTVFNPVTGKPVFVAPDFKTGITGGFDANGRPVMSRIAGSEVIPQIAGETKRAEAGAQADYDMITVNTPSGPMMMTRAQAAKLTGSGPVNIGGPQGLDLSKLTPEQQAYLAKTDPQAFANGTADFQRTGQQESSPSQGVGIPLETEAQKSFKTKQADNAATAAAALNERVRTGEDLMSRLGESRDALKKFQAGGGKETRAQVAQMAQAIGMPDSTVNKIAGGDLASMQEFQKLAVSQAMESLKQTMATDSGMGGRMTQAEFQQFLKVNPNLSTDPRAIEKLYNFSERIHQRNLTEQQAFDQWVAQGGDPARWPAEWSRRVSAGLPAGRQDSPQVAPSAAAGLPTMDAIEAELARRRKGK